MPEDKPDISKKPSFNEEAVKEGTQQLQIIMDNLAKFNELYHTLSPQEKAVVGGIIFNLVSVWGDFHLVGTVVERPYGAAMLNHLVAFFNSPQPMPVSPQAPGIQAFTEDEKKSRVN